MMLLLEPGSTDCLLLDAAAFNRLVLVIEGAMASGALKGQVWIATTVQGCLELGPTWTAAIVLSPTYSGDVEIAP
jgi:hypothetical protein